MAGHGRATVQSMIPSVKLPHKSAEAQFKVGRGKGRLGVHVEHRKPAARESVSRSGEKGNMRGGATGLLAQKRMHVMFVQKTQFAVRMARSARFRRFLTGDPTAEARADPAVRRIFGTSNSSTFINSSLVTGSARVKSTASTVCLPALCSQLDFTTILLYCYKLKTDSTRLLLYNSLPRESLF